MKWKLLLKVLPLTALFSLAKLGMHSLGWEPWAFDSLTGALFGAATFVIAFVLSGTLSDYNACEDMTVQLSNAVETIQDTNLLSAAASPDYDPKPIAKGLAQVLQATIDWLQQGKPFEEVEAALAQLNGEFVELQRIAGFPAVNRVQTELARMRILTTRMCLNRASDFLAPAYVLLQIFLIGSVIALLLIGADRFSENIVVSCFMFTSFNYLLLLIRDLDNPFQYDGKSSVDVDLSLLKATRDRLRPSP
ncbi:hypothetical protein [Leptolyngbya ohadii]|uniref:hypothetical protein n=1 Tax=Leptolyngbya ohadii TaxID=1962290 RepID=UPI000B59C51F|nr:hypothetical protein [Leptolyngbya ohadii]